MSTKDVRYYRDCPICEDKLIGTDDGLEAYESLKDQVSEIDGGTSEYSEPCCTLCGEAVLMPKAREIIAKGEPALRKT